MYCCWLGGWYLVYISDALFFERKISISKAGSTTVSVERLVAVLRTSSADFLVHLFVRMPQQHTEARGHAMCTWSPCTAPTHVMEKHQAKSPIMHALHRFEAFGQETFHSISALASLAYSQISSHNLYTNKPMMYHNTSTTIRLL